MASNQIDRNPLPRVAWALTFLLAELFAVPGLVRASAPRPSGPLPSTDKIRQLEKDQVAHPNDPQIESDLGAEYLRLANDTDDARLDPIARQHLDRALALKPTMAGTVALRGSLKCLEAKHRRNLGAGSRVEQGLADLDRAVKMAPDDEDVRMVRLSTLVLIPRRFEREEQALEDARWMEQQWTENASRKRPYSQGELYLRIGQAYRLNQRTEEARAAWQVAVKTDPDSDYGHQAERLLEKTSHLMAR